MLSQNIRILDFDASVSKQKNLLQKYPHKVVNLRDLAPQARLWMNGRTKDAVAERIRETSGQSVTFIGSGDFHHLTPLLLAEFKRPISLIVFDLHPDWDILPPRFGCGSWVTEALRKKNILKCLLIGIASGDISCPWIQSANLNALSKDRLEIYPYSHSPSLVFLRKIPENISLRVEESFLRSRIYWDELRGKNLKDFFLKAIGRLAVKNVYVSIDKDCLKNEYALTNWEEGKLALDELLMLLKLIKENLDIAGLDITGDYSKISVSGRLKGVLSRLDHPKEVGADKFPEEEITRLNESTNLKILEALI
ncbi:MAG: hypothetical protein PHV92_03345 [Candidatus Omnitrophica bacterium]|nr:hypothetical protein [Candidatus Omnitrophota bacterium]MDD5517964.1 hypothetical protein [Candidatus Omnitrophota bacterium]